jgi:membrane-bound ClpP family serine protease
MALIITLLVVGLLLIALETVLPGLAAAIAGSICLIIGIVLAYRELGFYAGTFTLLGVTAALSVGVALWFRFFPNSPLGQRFVSKSEVGSLGVEKPELLNQTGVALTDLRPSGLAEIAGRRIDVVTEGSMVARGAPLRVVAVEGARVVVRETT